MYAYASNVHVLMGSVLHTHTNRHCTHISMVQKERSDPGRQSSHTYTHTHTTTNTVVLAYSSQRCLGAHGYLKTDSVHGTCMHTCIRTHTDTHTHKHIYIYIYSLYRISMVQKEGAGLRKKLSELLESSRISEDSVYLSRKVFSLLDVDKSGEIDAEEAKQLLLGLQVCVCVFCLFGLSVSKGF
jgi:hypothetical protein